VELFEFQPKSEKFDWLLKLKVTEIQVNYARASRYLKGEVEKRLNLANLTQPAQLYHIKDLCQKKLSRKNPTESPVVVNLNNNLELRVNVQIKSSQFNFFNLCFVKCSHCKTHIYNEKLMLFYISMVLKKQINIGIFLRKIYIT
jgi:hypothetical protein